MAHARTTIRNRIKTLLQAGVTLVDSANIVTSNLYEFDADTNAAINITTSEDELRDRDFSGTELRTLDVNISIYVQATEDYDTSLDDICSEVETALAADHKLGIGAEDSHFVSFRSEFSDELETPLASGEMIWRVAYSINSTDPTTIL